ncbi:MAG TPA: MaoC family dehydratase [Blastocatellia bacterium]|nr:MaoC family dehydratase [Blastocatellia bacterium]
MSERAPGVFEPRYGRLLDDFRVGEVYHHPWEVTIDDGMLALFAASFLDPNPLYSSRRYARDMGFRDRVVHPMVLLNLALSFSVHDVSEQAIAHLAYIDLTFPNAAYAGDSISAASEVLSIRVSESKPDRGIIHLRTTGVNQEGTPVVTFERKALIPTGRLEGRAHLPVREVNNRKEGHTGHLTLNFDSLPRQLALDIKLPRWPGRPRGLFEDYEVGDTITHSTGRTIGNSEHMQLTVLTRNSHPLHFDEVYSRERSFAAKRVVEGGLVFAWVCSLSSRDTSANALWEMGYDRGSHPAPVFAGDTIYAASRVIEKVSYNEKAGVVRFQLIGTRNEKPARLLEAGVNLFEDRFEQKVFEIERALLLPKRSSLM